MTASATWVTVFQGPLWEVHLLQGRLETEGLETFIPDQNIKRVDPFITGAGALVTSLQVPEPEAAFAAQLIATVARDGPEASVPSTGDEDPELEEVRRLGHRVRWASLSVLLFPFAIVYGVRYLSRVRALGRKPPGHALNLAAFAFVGVVLTAVVLALVLADPIISL